ncbi:MAG: hypothetical protein ABI333_05345 [bacterium]
MSDIGAVVARSRLPGGFSERKTFTLARSRAIRKMREFALADPYYFVLELIQAAVANGATYINVATDDKTFTLSYTRGYFREEELGQLFDFLFAGKDRTDIGHVRELALGINALFLFNPDRIVVESGDGTLQGTTRMEVTQGAEHVTIGKPKAPLRGTYIRADNVNRRAVRKKTALEPLPGMPMEAAAIEERCLTAPIPLLVNDTPLFGYTVRRIPRLLGYRRTIEFDEGDLFGALGVEPLEFTASFKLLTYGVWIQSVSQDLLGGGVGVGGILCFDRLHKTADHAGIVHDEVWDEMWARLLPYAQQLHSGASGVVTGSVAMLSGAALNARELRPLLRASERVVTVDRELQPTSREGVAATEIGRALDALVIKASRADEAWLRGLAGPGVTLLRPDLFSEVDRAFFTGQRPCELPPRPWLAPPVTVASVSLGELVKTVAAAYHAALQPADGDEQAALASQKQITRESLALAGEVGEVVATVYTPAEPPSSSRLTVEVVTVERLVWQGQLPSAYPGHVVRVELPDLSPALLLRSLWSLKEAPPLAHTIAQAVVHRASSALAAAAGRALEQQHAVDGTASPVLRAIALASLSRSLISRLRPGREGDRDNAPRVAFSLLESAAGGLLDQPLLPTLSGSWVSMHQLAGIMNATGGLLYGVIPTVPPALEGLDVTRILQLHADEEQLLISLVGDAAYVRVDRRDVLAEHRGVQCRDLALGLRDYPDFPLLVEGVDPTAWTPEEQRSCVETLTLQLASCYLGITPERPDAPGARAAWEENRRQACRHLQWFVCRRASGAAESPDHGVGDLPLFVDSSGEAWTFRQVARSLEQPAGVRLHLRPKFGGSVLGALAAAAAAQGRAGAGSPTGDTAAPGELAVSPLVARLLAQVGNVRVAMDFELPHEAPEDPEESLPEFLERAEVSGEGFRGVVGLPTDPAARPEVYVLDAQGTLHAHHERAREYGLVGLVRLVDRGLDGALGERISTGLKETGERLVESLIRRLTQLDSRDERYHPIARRLLQFAGERLQLYATHEAQLTGEVRHPVAQQVLELPLFPTVAGTPISGTRLIRAFCTFGSVLAKPGAAQDERRHVTVSADAPAYLRHWVLAFLTEARVVRPASSRSAPLPAVLQRADRPADEQIAVTIEHWLEELRPDRLSAGEGEARLPIRVLIRSGDVFANFTDPRELMAYTFFERIPTALLNGDHWLVRWAGARLRTDPEALAALLLACYAHINAVLDPVTNTHEQVFQLRVVEALERGALKPPTDASAPEGAG